MSTQNEAKRSNSHKYSAKTGERVVLSGPHTLDNYGVQIRVSDTPDGAAVEFTTEDDANAGSKSDWNPFGSDIHGRTVFSDAEEANALYQKLQSNPSWTEDLLAMTLS
jgi:hypothetical protein